MAITYVQGFPPKWYIVGIDGLAAGGAQLFTYDSLTRLPKAAYQDPGGTIPFTNPIIFDLNGTKGPIYFKLDSATPTDLYYLEAFDSEGNLLWTVDDFPTTGSGGGSDVTTYIPIQNYITNNQFINHIAAQAGPLTTNLVIAPSNHHGFTPAQVNPKVGTYGVLGPDIRFIKNNTSATDSIDFPLFALSSAPLTGDVTPVDYIRYVSNSVGGEVYKNFQFPITQKVKNLSNQAMTFTLWAASTSGTPTLTIFCRQYYGSGTGATAESASTYTTIGTCSLTTSWTPFNIQFTVPDVSGNSIGTPGLQTDDDAVYIEIGMPLGSACDVLFTKPCLFLGSIDPDIEFDSYDQIDAIDQTARTGDIKTSLTTIAPLGWVPMNDSTIGNTGSGASVAGSYTFQLYSTIYTAVVDANAPVSGGRTAPGNTMATAITDFLANKTLTLPLSLGRAMAGAGSGAGLPSYTLGQNTGAVSTAITLVAANLPPHSHTIPNTSVAGTASGGSGTSFASPVSFTLQSGNGPGTSTPFSVATVQPSTFLNVFIKL